MTSAMSVAIQSNKTGEEEKQLSEIHHHFCVAVMGLMMGANMTRILGIAFLLAVSLLLLSEVCMGFHVHLPTQSSVIHRRRHHHHHNSIGVSLHAAGMGMGVEKGKKTSAKKKGSSPFDASASLIRLEKIYDELSFQSAKAIAQRSKDKDDDDDNDDDNDDENNNTNGDSSSSSGNTMSFEYVVAARSTSGLSSHAAVADWVPIAQLICTCNSEGVADQTRQAAVSLYCRELAHAASLGAPVFQNVARKDLQYSTEAVDSFYKHVYDVVHRNVDDTNNANGSSSSSSSSSNAQTMSKTEARSVLQLQEDETDMKVIKQSYRKLSFDLHPDRVGKQTSFNGDKDDDADDDKNGTDFYKIKLAYDTLTSGVRSTGSSWYQSLGGRARTEFSGPITLLSMEAAQQLLDKAGVKSAVCGIDCKLVQSFVTRHQAAV